MTTIYFVRHAQPERGADSPYTDATYPLTAKGMADRNLVTAFLQDKNIDVVLSSPFKRAVDTVGQFAEQKGLQIEIIDDFRERAITDKWLPIEDFKVFARRQWDDVDYKLPQGESFVEVYDRNLAALENVLEKYHGKNIVVGAHGMALSTLLRHFDAGYGYDEHMYMPMPYVAKLVFDQLGVCYAGMKVDLFDPHKKSNGKWRVTTAELGELKAYRYTVIFARYQDKWLYCRHKLRDVFETPGGSIEPSETPLDGAKRELMEETGAAKFDIFPAFDYAVYTDLGFANGQVFFANITDLGVLSNEYEMAEVCSFDTIPGRLRFPQILPVLYAKMEQWMMDNKAVIYEQEARERYGNDAIDRSNVKVRGMTQQQQVAAVALSDELNVALKAAFELGDPTSTLAQKACELHKQWLCVYWDTYSSEAHMGVAQMYVDDPRFTAYYDKIAVGCAAFLRDAVTVYCGMGMSE